MTEMRHDDLEIPRTEAWREWETRTLADLRRLPLCHSAQLAPVGNRMAQLTVSGAFGNEPEAAINAGLAAAGRPTLDILERGSSTMHMVAREPIQWSLNLLVATDFDIFRKREPMPTDPKPVELTMSRYGHPREVPYATLREALEDVAADVEHNAAAPKSLTVPTTLIGHPPVTFNAAEIYALLSLVRAED